MMASCSRAFPTNPAFAAPDEGSGIPIPSMRGCLDPINDLLGRLGILALQGAALEDSLDRLGHVEPTSAQGRVGRHNPVGKEPEHDGGGQVPLEIVPDEQHPQAGQRIGQRDAHGQSLLPAFPLPVIRDAIADGLWFGQGGEDLFEFRFEPGMEDGVGGLAHAFDPDLTRGGVKQGELFDSPFAHVLVGIADRITIGVPVGTRVGTWYVLTITLF